MKTIFIVSLLIVILVAGFYFIFRSGEPTTLPPITQPTIQPQINALDRMELAINKKLEENGKPYQKQNPISALDRIENAIKQKLRR